MDYSETEMASYTSFDGQSFDIHIWDADQPKAVMLAFHGGMAHAGDYEAFGLYFKEHGYSTVAPDLRGHKQKRTHIKQFSDYLEDANFVVEWVEQRYPELPIYIVGHSMGGLLACFMGLGYWRDRHFGGYIMSSPYIENAVGTPAILQKLSGLLAIIFPKMKAPIDNFIDVLTHDPDITARYKRDQEKNIRGSEISVSFGHAMLSSQKRIQVQLPEWDKHTFVVVAGKDELAKASVTEQFFKDRADVTYISLPDNYHENFSEVNRNETFDAIIQWIG